MHKIKVKKYLKRFPRHSLVSEPWKNCDIFAVFHIWSVLLLVVDFHSPHLFCWMLFVLICSALKSRVLFCFDSAQKLLNIFRTQRFVKVCKFKIRIAKILRYVNKGFLKIAVLKKTKNLARETRRYLNSQILNLFWIV